MSNEDSNDAATKTLGSQPAHDLFVHCDTLEQGVRRLAYSLKEGAEMLGVSEGHLRNEHRRGKLKFSKSSSRTLILASELDRYLRELPERPIPIEVASDDDVHYRSVFDGPPH